MPGSHPPRLSAREQVAYRPSNDRFSGCEALSSPRAARLFHVAQAIVETTGTSLPELELLGHDAIPAPPRRPRHAVAVLLSRDREARFERLAAVDHLALSRGIDTPAALHWARREVGVGFFRTHLLGAAVDAHLPLERAPVKHQAAASGCGQLLALAAVVVGVEHEAAVVQTLEEDGAN